jgi:hypothetical protein
MFTFTTANPHPKFSFCFSRQNLQKPFNLYGKLLIMMSIIVKVSLRQLTTSVALASLQNAAVFLSMQTSKHCNLNLENS